MNTIKILDKQTDFIAVHKPAGIGFHRENDQPGLFQQVQQQTGLDSLFPVHRLDKITSGIVLFATHQEAAKAFGVLFENHQIEKYYLALAASKPSKKQGLIKGDMEKSRRGTWKLARSTHNPAITQFISYGTPLGVRIFLLKPHTGKTHQLRVALKSLGSPILGDTLYGGTSIDKTISKTADRGYLHAFAIRFSLGEKRYAYCTLPETGTWFNRPEISTMLSRQLFPPWEVPFPKL
ncbi:MAG: TIGR01621 family pseudouridine synthase [Gammaproteobacteria bacterium]|nr:MAG: TIGR01621 family pseudouridine synthase [Gammaproteobacteria bacterium]